MRVRKLRGRAHCLQSFFDYKGKSVGVTDARCIPMRLPNGDVDGEWPRFLQLPGYHPLPWTPPVPTPILRMFAEQFARPKNKEKWIGLTVWQFNLWLLGAEDLCLSCQAEQAQATFNIPDSIDVQPV